ncbi:hypothetical protein TPR58_16710 [Sphingomonas sp. HF-S3]|uniref:Secreted protein n=1 Tax=Sphingomonas rustica TaxID=3103142 RepID=A0ABV0BB79_9SPHN
MKQYLPRAAIFVTALFAMLISGSCGMPRKSLSATELSSCKSQGGYESRTAFGSPICQFDYSDALKVCSDKSDCKGMCRLMVTGASGEPSSRPGDPAQGQCQATSYDPGCYATVEGGKITGDGAICED